MFGAFRFVARRTSTNEARDRVLAPAAPLVIVVWLFSWLVLFMIGFTLILMVTGQLMFGDAWHEAGSSLLTLGFAWSGRVQLSTVDFVAAATGTGDHRPLDRLPPRAIYVLQPPGTHGHGHACPGQ